MIKKEIKNKTEISINNSIEGESIEEKVNRIVNNGEPIKDGAPLIYTERKEGVKAEYDIRTDRFDIAVNAMNYASKSEIAKRANKQVVSNESTQATE